MQTDNVTKLNSNTDNLSENIFNLEKKYWAAMRDHDLESALSLTNFPCIVVSAKGTNTIDRAQFEKMFTSHQQDLIKEMNFEENPEVRQLGPDTAVIAYKVNSVIERDGKMVSMNAVDASTWIRRDGKWVCAMHTEIELPDAKH